MLAVCFIRWIVHYKAPTNKNLVIHHTVYHRAMVTEALAMLRAAAEAIDTEVRVLFDEESFVLEPECAAKLEVFFLRALSLRARSARDLWLVNLPLQLTYLGRLWWC